MTSRWVAFIAVGAAIVIIGFALTLWQLMRLSRQIQQDKQEKATKEAAYDKMAIEEVNHLFNEKFREELRNHGRLYFEKVINENAMFLKQDLDLTISQINEYLKKEIGGKLEEEFAAYTKAMRDAQQLAQDSLRKSANAVEEHRAVMTEALKKDVAEKEAVLVKNYEENMAAIVEHYVLQALNDQFDLKSQLPHIIQQMEANKEDIINDMRL